MLTVMTFFTRSAAGVGILLSVLLLVLLMSRIRTGAMKWLFIPVIASIPSTFAVFILSYWFEIHHWRTAILRGGMEAFLYSGRLSILVIANILFVRTTDFRRLIEGLRSIWFPPVAVLLLITVFRFFPVFLDEVQRIYEVQRVRGLNKKQFLLPKYWLPLALPFIIVTIQRAYELALSFHLRGGMRLLRRKRLSFQRVDFIILGIAICVGILMTIYY